MNEVEMEKSIGEAMKAKMRRHDTMQKRSAEVERKEQLSPTALKEQIIAFGDPHETVAEALQRLSSNKSSGANENRGFTKREKKPTSSSSSCSEDVVVNSQKQQMLKLIDLSDQLSSRGLTFIYNTTFAALKNSLSSWEYRAADGTVYGPYSSEEIANWKEMGYFKGKFSCGHEARDET